MNNENEINPLPALADENVTRWLEANVEQLHAQARMLVDDYWRRMKKERKKHPASEQARIGVRIRRREKCLSFSIEWYRMATLRQNGQNKPIAQYLKKGPSYRYPLQRILKGEPEWEAVLVEEFETEFADIRKQMDLLGRVRDAFWNCRIGLEK